MKEIHCKDCGRFLLKIAFGEVEVKCTNSKCKSVNKVLVYSYKSMLLTPDK